MVERFTPQMYIEHYAAQRGIPAAEIRSAPVVVLSWSENVIQRLAERIAAQPVSNWIWGKRRPFFTGRVGDLEVSFAQVGIGSPATVTSMEEMIACGARTIIGLGWAGSLQPEAAIGSLLIPTACLREEGTSPHYVEDISQLAPDPELVRLLAASAQACGLPYQQGVQWTTDAPYRELRHKIQAYREVGVIGVDMETSAMYALGLFRQAAVCNLLVVSDEVWREWRTAAFSAELRDATMRAEEVVFRMLQALPAPE